MASALGATALQATLVSVAFSVTGISAKINKAAGKVFGDDLVNVANIFGAGYAMFNGGFDIGGTPDPAAMNVPTGAEAGDLFQSQMSAQGFEPAAIESAAQGNVFDAVLPQADTVANAEFDQDWADMAAGKEALSEVQGVDLNTGAPTGVDPKAVTDAVTPTTDTQLIQQQGTGAAGTGAAKQVANTATASDAAALKAAAPTPGVNPPAGSNVFEKMFYTTDKAGNRVFNDRMAGALIQGVGGAVGGYMTAQQQQQALDWQKQKYNTRPTGRIIA